MTRLRTNYLIQLFSNLNSLRSVSGLSYSSSVFSQSTPYSKSQFYNKYSSRQILSRSFSTAYPSHKVVPMPALSPVRLICGRLLVYN